MARNTPTSTRPSTASILRSVASSSSIETGQRTASIEKRLKANERKFPKIGLAN